MPEHYDALETRDQPVREREQFARLSDIDCARNDGARLGKTLAA